MIILTFFVQSCFYFIDQLKTIELNKIVYFDGICNLCNWSVRFIINHDKQRIFSFASLQSRHAKSNLTYINGQGIKYDSVVYQDDDIILTKSDAVLKICKQLSGGWKLLYIFKIVPSGWRDRLYDIVASNRYQWFGKKDHCMIPAPEIRSRFLD